LQNPHELRTAKRPAVPKHLIVEILNPEAGEFTKNIQGIQDLLQIDQRDFKGKALVFDFDLQGSGGVSVSASGVKEDKVDSACRGLGTGHSVCHLCCSCISAKLFVLYQ
jgi:hypothetical protein